MATAFNTDQSKVAGETVTIKADVARDGYAAIKPEFLLHSFSKRVDVDFVSAPVQREVGKVSEAEPPIKKLKLKGRNKQRPRDQRIKAEEKLCYSIYQKVACAHGDQCKYMHDVKAFLDKQPPDIGDFCPIFEQFGVCDKGATCRFARSHVTEQGQNKLNEEKLSSVIPLIDTYRNHLTPELRTELRQKRVDFSVADAATRQAHHVIESRRETSFQLPGAKVQGHSNGKQDGVMQSGTSVHTCGAVTNEEIIPLRPAERKKVDFRDKLYLAPLTTVGNLPFRRICKRLGADVTCGEMALATQLLQGNMSEWALVRRHESEDCFGVQVCGGYPDTMSRCAELLNKHADLDFLDINVGCPIDLVCNKGAGSGLMAKRTRFETVVRSMSAVCHVPLTCKIRTGVMDNKRLAHSVVPHLSDWGIDLCTLHGRSKLQRYTRSADWAYIGECKQAALAAQTESGNELLFFGNGDVLSYEDYNNSKELSGVDGIMIARGALVKPWLFTEIKEQRHWDISASERFDIFRDFTRFGLEHWGSDAQGVQTTRKFLLEWLSFTHRYIPVGVLERVPHKINERPPAYVGRNDLETMLGSSYCGDWIKISEMLLGPVPEGFTFLPKHKANAYKTDDGAL